MGKSALCLILAVIAIGTGSVDAAFVIKLKNGNEFVTARYWQDGSQVLFDVYGGVFGVEKAFVVKIDRSDKPLSLVVDAPHSPEEKSPASGVIIRSETNNSAFKNDQSKIKRVSDDPIIKEFEAVKQRFATINEMLTSELDEFSKDVAGLKRRIQSSSAPNDYFKEFTELHNIGDHLEDVLKERNQ